MPYKIDAHVAHQNHLRANAPENHYIRELEKRGHLLRLDNVVVDMEQLVFRTFACDTSWCVRCKGEGSEKQFKGSCCTDLQVDVTEHEVHQYERLATLAIQRGILSETDPLRKVVSRILKNKITTVTDKGDIALHQIKSGRCSLSWIGPDGSFLCAINSLCERLGEPLDKYKAEPCYLFPLHYAEFLPGQYFVTVICKETIPFIGADEYVGKLRCLSKPKPGAPPAYRFLKNEIIFCFGQALYEAIEEGVNAYLNREAAPCSAATSDSGTILEAG